MKRQLESTARFRHGHEDAEPAAVCIIGCGRRMRRDDQAGLSAGDLLSADPPAGARVMTTESPAADVPVLLEGVRAAIIIDATPATAAIAAGTIRRIEYHRERALLRGSGVLDTHSVSLTTALSLAEELHVLPAKVWIYVIGGSDFGYGAGMSPPVEWGVREIARRVRNHCAHLARLKTSVGANHA